MMKLSEICESHWSEMNRRSQGITKRKEEDLENFNRSEFFEYLKSRYKVINAPNGEDIWSSDSDITEIPILADPKRKYTQNGKNYNFVYKLQIWNIDHEKMDMSFHISASVFNRESIFSQTLEKQFRIIRDLYLWYTICPNATQDELFPELTKRFIIKVIDFIIENPGPYKLTLAKR